MFVITDNNSTKSFEKRDDLLYWLETMNAKARTTEELQKFSLSYVTSDDEIIEQKEIYVPFSESVDEKLANFGVMKEKRKFFSFGKNKHFHQEQEKVEVIEEEVTVPQKKVVGMTHVLTSVVSSSSSSVKEEKKGSESLSQHKQHKSKAPSSSGGGTSFFSKLLPLNAFFISILSITIAAVTFWQVQQVGPLQKANQRLTSQLKEIKDYQDSQHEIDLFARYFLPVYYSGDKATVETYFSKSTFEKLKASPKAQLQSVILEKMTQKDKDFYVTYVIGVLQNDKRKNMRLSFTIHQDKKSDRDWVVTSIPEEADY